MALAPSPSPPAPRRSDARRGANVRRLTRLGCTKMVCWSLKSETRPGGVTSSYLTADRRDLYERRRGSMKSILPPVSPFRAAITIHCKFLSRARQSTTPAETPDVSTVVYLIRSPDGGRVKIGRTTNVTRRLAEIQRMSPVPLAVLWQTDGDRALELSLHRTFANHRSHGEWFDFGGVDPVALVEEAASR